MGGISLGRGDRGRAFAGAAVAAGGSVAHLISGKDIAANSSSRTSWSTTRFRRTTCRPGLFGRSRREGPAGASGGRDGKDGKDGVSAYGFVVPGEVSLNVNPVLVDARSHNIDRVTSPRRRRVLPDAEGWDRRGVALRGPVTPEKSRSTVPSNLMFAYADTGLGTCPAGQLAVRTYELNITKLRCWPLLRRSTLRSWWSFRSRNDAGPAAPSRGPRRVRGCALVVLLALALPGVASASRPPAQGNRRQHADALREPRRGRSPSFTPFTPRSSGST